MVFPVKPGAIAAALLLASAAIAQSPATHRIEVTVAPHASGGVVDYVDVTMTLSNMAAATGQPLLRLPLSAAGSPSVRLDGDALKATDSSGPIPLTIDDDKTPAAISFRRWIAGRPVSGEVALRYRGLPRTLTATTRSTPHFDLRAESGGASGGGLGLFVLPIGNDDIIDMTARWNLAGMPTGTVGVWNTSEGDLRVTGTAETVQGTFYMVGPVKRLPATGPANFRTYWLTQPNFDVESIAGRTKTFFEYASRYFKDANPEFTVFIRENPMRGGRAGTHLTNSFIFGWNREELQPTDEFLAFLAHEVAHSWPMLDGEYGIANWFAEGGAEYYSVLLLQKSGAFDEKQFLAAINRMADSYYSNPRRSVTNVDVRDGGFRDGQVIRVPYGRGFLYLARVDAQLHTRSGGKKNLRDLVLELNQRRANGKPADSAVWEQILARELGPHGVSEYKNMVAGKIFAPTGAFAPCYQVLPHRLPTLDLGFDQSSVNSPDKVVHGVVTGSVAYRAGLRNGDVLLKAQGISSWQEAPGLAELEVRRGEKTLIIRYPTAGAMANGFQWARVGSVPESACKL